MNRERLHVPLINQSEHQRFIQGRPLPVDLVVSTGICWGQKQKGKELAILLHPAA